MLTYWNCKEPVPRQTSQPFALFSVSDPVQNKKKKIEVKIRAEEGLGLRVSNIEPKVVLQLRSLSVTFAKDVCVVEYPDLQII